MEKLNSDEMFRYLIDNAFLALEELSAVEKERPLTQFEFGLKTVHVELLETLQNLWEGAEAAGLDWDVEERFPV